MEKDKGLDFMEYFATGEENPEKKEAQIIDEGLVDVIFKTMRTNIKTSINGPLVFFKWEWMNNKTFITIRVKKATLESFLKWLNGIMEDDKA